MHVSNGATVIILETQNTVSVNISKMNILNTEKSFKNIKKESKKKLTLTKKKKRVKKLYNQIQEKRQSNISFNANSKTDSIYSVNSCYNNTGVNNQDNHKTLDNSVHTEKISLSFLFIYQEKQNILFLIYHSKLLDSNLFTRPPPLRWS